MTSRVWTKKQTQATIKDFRNNGYTVVRRSEGWYQCHVDGVLVFNALIGSNGTYLVRYETELFEPPQQS